MRIGVVLCVGEAARFGPLFEALGATVLRKVEGPLRARQLRGEELDLVLVDAPRLGRDAARTVAAVRALAGSPEVIALSRQEGPADRARLLASGCMAVLHADVPLATLRDALGALVDRRREELQRQRTSQSAMRGNSLDDFASSSRAMRLLLDTARRVVPSTATLLILGETGVGKEWLARALHAEGPRRAGPFVAVNCGALPEHLLESELFGHERGAFTGALRAHRGHFEMAHGGTLFLDEVGEMPLPLQVKLLRVLQERCIQRVGSERTLDVDVRLMAATHRDPGELRARGLLRDDLYFRLAVVTLRVPPLRERLEDLPALAQTYLERFGVAFGRGARTFAPAALESLLTYRWPGNLRELVNVVERTVLLSGGDEITLADLPDEFRRAEPVLPEEPAAPERGAACDLPFAEARRQVLERFEREYLANLLERAGGRVGEAALRAGLHPRSLYDLLRRHGLKWRAYRFAAR